MGSLGNPKPWVPYMINTKDCSQGFCSLYCPQWCYVMFPPPPPIEFYDDHKDATFSPLVIAVIGVLASAFLLVTYYAIISKYCKKRDSSNGREIQNPIEESQENQDSLPDDSFQGSNNGLDEALIKSITMFKFKKQERLTEATDCSVCLSEFEENESLRLLPKCNHAFHKKCIDIWLKFHSNCPLCRSNIVFVSSLPPQLSPVVEAPTHEEPSSQSPDHVIDNVASEEEDIEMGVQELDFYSNIQEEAPNRHLRNLDNSDVYNNISMIKNNEGEQMRRSISMDRVSHYQLSVADVLRIDQEEEDQRVDQCPYWDGAETSKRAVIAMCKSSCGNGVVHCVAGGAILRRSLSSGRFLLSNGGGKGRNVSIPL